MFKILTYYISKLLANLGDTALLYLFTLQATRSNKQSLIAAIILMFDPLIRIILTPRIAPRIDRMVTFAEKAQLSIKLHLILAALVLCLLCIHTNLKSLNYFLVGLLLLLRMIVIVETIPHTAVPIHLDKVCLLSHHRGIALNNFLTRGVHVVAPTMALIVSSRLLPFFFLFIALVHVFAAFGVAQLTKIIGNQQLIKPAPRAVQSSCSSTLAYAKWYGAKLFLMNFAYGGISLVLIHIMVHSQTHTVLTQSLQGPGMIYVGLFGAMILLWSSQRLSVYVTSSFQHCIVLLLLTAIAMINTGIMGLSYLPFNLIIYGVLFGVSVVAASANVQKITLGDQFLRYQSQAIARGQIGNICSLILMSSLLNYPFTKSGLLVLSGGIGLVATVYLYYRLTRITLNKAVHATDNATINPCADTKHPFRSVDLRS